jgi:hypothetical protein
MADLTGSLGQSIVEVKSIAVTSSATWTAASTSGAASAINASLSAAANKLTYVTGFQVTGLGATAGSTIFPYLSGVAGGSTYFAFTVPTGATVAASPLVIQFATPMPASATNTNITLNVPSFGAGNTTAACSIQGFYV